MDCWTEVRRRVECCRSRCLDWSEGLCLIGGCPDRRLAKGVFRCPGCGAEFTEAGQMRGHLAADSACDRAAREALARAKA